MDVIVLVAQCGFEVGGCVVVGVKAVTSAQVFACIIGLVKVGSK